MQKENKHTLWILTLHSNSHHTAFLPSFIACCALVESRGGHGEILQQNPSRVVVVYTSRRNDCDPLSDRVYIYCLLYRIYLRFCNTDC